MDLVGGTKLISLIRNIEDMKMLLTIKCNEAEALVRNFSFGLCDILGL